MVFSAHTTAEHIQYVVVDKRYFIGNTFADAFAVLAAVDCQLDGDVIASYEFSIARATIVRKRLTAVLQRVQDFDKELKAKIAKETALGL